MDLCPYFVGFYTQGFYRVPKLEEAPQENLMELEEWEKEEMAE